MIKEPLIASTLRYDIMLTCWNENPEERGSFEDLKSNIEKILYSIQVGTRFFIFGFQFEEGCK